MPGGGSDVPDRDLGGPQTQFDSPGYRTWAGRRPPRSRLVAFLLALALLATLLGSTTITPLPTLSAASISAAVTAPTTCPPAPYGCPTADPHNPTIYYGAAPLHPDASKPVL